jgi:hypothetical protein
MISRFIYLIQALRAFLLLALAGFSPVTPFWSFLQPFHNYTETLNI